MSSAKLARRFFWVVWVSALLVTSSAHAQDLDATTRSAARALGYAGVEAFQKGDYATASDKLDRAFKTFQMPSLGLWSARAREKLGHLVEAAERYREVTTLKPSAGEEDVQRKAIEDAAAELKAIEPRIPSIVVMVEGATGSGLVVTLDNAQLPSTLIGEALPVNPGTHHLTAQLGPRVADQSVVVRESDRSQLVLRLDGAPGIGPSQAAPGPPPKPTTEPPTTRD